MVGRKQGQKVVRRSTEELAKEKDKKDKMRFERVLNTLELQKLASKLEEVRTTVFGSDFFQKKFNRIETVALVLDIATNLLCGKTDLEILGFKLGKKVTLSD